MIAAWGARLAVDALSATWRMPATAPRPRGRQVILAVWHGQLLPALCFHRGQPITLLVSAHRDGEYLARAAGSWGFGTVRGSSTRRGVSGLRALVRALRAGRDAAITPDGPRGPARQVKPGVLAAAQLTGAPIVPVGAAATQVWKLASWDRFEVPRPLARVAVTYGAPVAVGPGPAGRAAAATELALALDRANEVARCSL